MIRKIIFAIAGIVSVVSSQAQIAVDNTQTVEYYVQNVLLGTGVTAFNITFNGVPANQVSTQVGSFDCVDCNVGIANGFVMASGDAQLVVGPNSTGGLTLGGQVNFDGPDPDLNAISTGFGINDWAIIEFDFIPAGDSVKFNYVWGSEEYMEWVNSSFNDVFGFFLSGPGINGPYSNGAINIAQVPGTTLPVTIDNVNLNLNGQYYVDNGDGFEAPFNGSPFYIQFDGFTVPLLAEAQVVCGETYHIKLACADSGDSALDCGVFFEEGSFSSNFVTVSSEVGVSNPPSFLPSNSLLEGCIDGFFTIFPPNNLTEPVDVTFTIGGAAANGTDYETINSTIQLTPGAPTEIAVTTIWNEEQEGTEDITITYIYENSCGELDTATATLFIVDYVFPTVTMDDLFICPGAINTANPNEQFGAPPYIYQWSSGETSATVNYEQGDAGEYTVSITDYCENSASDSFMVIEPAPFEAVEEAEICLGTNSDPLASGGAQPYTYTYDELGLEYSGTTAVFGGITAGAYIITITDACGQSADVPVLVEECDTWIPNVFTPDGSGKNDSFVIWGLDGFPGSELYVYNRWGSLVFESTNYRDNWRGTDLPDGVYYYIFKRSDGENYEGYVHLLRKQ
jgi:gliding motility-associated-like protein